jgi:hypothetical protein
MFEAKGRTKRRVRQKRTPGGTLCYYLGAWGAPRIRAGYRYKIGRFVGYIKKGAMAIPVATVDGRQRYEKPVSRSVSYKYRSATRTSKLGPQTSFYATQLDKEEHAGSVEASPEEVESQTYIGEEKAHAET